MNVSRFIPVALLLVGIAALAFVFAGGDEDDTSTETTVSENVNTTDTSGDEANVSPVEDEVNGEAFVDTPPDDSSSFSEGNTDLNLSAPGSNGVDFSAPFGAIEVVVPEQVVAPGDGTLTIVVSMPDGYKLNALAPMRTSLISSSNSVEVPDAWADWRQETPPLPLEVPLTFNAGSGELVGDMTIYWCEAINEELCFVDSAEITIPVVVDENADSSNMTATVELVPPEL